MLEDGDYNIKVSATVYILGVKMKKVWKTSTGGFVLGPKGGTVSLLKIL